MFDLRLSKTLNLNQAECLKDETTYQFVESLTGKKLIAKFISYYNDEGDIYLITEFKKLVMLSGEPEIATVYYLATGEIKESKKSCYVMDFIDGNTLEKFLQNRETIIFEVAIDILIQIASGIEKAHNYEIYHSDLHNENIIIDNFGYVKLIDFLWWDYNLPKEKNLLKDVEDFKRIANELYNKCRPQDKIRFNVINEYCQSVSSFKSLKKELEQLEDVSFEISLLNDDSIILLSKLLELTENEYNLNLILKYEDLDIPEKHIPALTKNEREKVDKMKANPNALKYMDSREGKINAIMKKVLELKLYNLKQVNLIDWDVCVENHGDLFEGPYKLNFIIIFNIKFMKWKRIFESLPILTRTAKTVEELILE